MELPIYYIDISDDMTDENGFEFVSIVDKPAIKREYLKFDEYLKFTTNDQQIVTGPAIIVDMPLLRKVGGREFYTVFDKANTAKAVKKWAVNQKYNAVNTAHDAPVNTMFLFESYLINRDRGITPPKEFSDVPDGSWFLSYYVQDEILWGKIKAGEFNGFSVEGLFGLEAKENFSDVAKVFADELNKFVATISQ